MVFFVTPDSVSQAVYQESFLVAAAPSVSASATGVRKMTYGVCEIMPANLEGDSGNGRSLNEGSWVTYMLSRQMQERLASNMDADALAWYGEWEKSFKVAILRSPEYGRMANDRGELTDPKYASYRPNPGFVGQDRVDLLVEAKDDLGQPIAMTIRYFLNVLPRKEIEKLTVTNSSYLNAVKKFCGEEFQGQVLHHNI